MQDHLSSDLALLIISTFYIVSCSSNTQPVHFSLFRASTKPHVVYLARSTVDAAVKLGIELHIPLQQRRKGVAFFNGYRFAYALGEAYHVR